MRNTRYVFLYWRPDLTSTNYFHGGVFRRFYSFGAHNMHLVGSETAHLLHLRHCPLPLTMGYHLVSGRHR